MQSGYDARSSQRGSYFDYLLDGDTTAVADTSITAAVGLFGERIVLGQPVIIYCFLMTLFLSLFLSFEIIFSDLRNSKLSKLSQNCSLVNVNILSIVNPC